MMAKRQAQEAAGALSSSPKGLETSNSRCVSSLKLDCYGSSDLLAIFELVKVCLNSSISDSVQLINSIVIMQYCYPAWYIIRP
jgi:hypothetical protein